MHEITHLNAKVGSRALANHVASDEIHAYECLEVLYKVCGSNLNTFDFHQLLVAGSGHGLNMAPLASKHECTVHQVSIF